MSTAWGGAVRSDAELGLADDRGLLLGDGVFETIHVVAGEPRFLARHFARLASGAATIGAPVPAALAGEVVRLVPLLHAAEGSPPRGALRVTLTRGAARPRGLAPTPGAPSLILTYTALPACDAASPADPVRAVCVTAPRIDPFDPAAGVKHTSRLAWVLARRAALAAGADVALLPTSDGDVAEGDAANLFVVVRGDVVTPSVDRGVLPGITRARAIEALRAAGRFCAERRVARLELASADEAFLTSSLDGVRPLAAVDGRALQAPGPVALWLAGALASGTPDALEVVTANRTAPAQ